MCLAQGGTSLLSNTFLATDDIDGVVCRPPAPLALAGVELSSPATAEDFEKYNLLPSAAEASNRLGLTEYIASYGVSYTLLRRKTLRSITCCLRRRNSPTGYGLRTT